MEDRDIDFEHRLTEVEQRAKSNTIRIDEHDQEIKENNNLILFMTWDTGIDQEMRLILLLSPECYQVRSIKGCTSLTRDIMILIQKRLY